MDTFKDTRGLYVVLDNAQQTTIDAYRLVYNGGDVAEPTAFPFGVISGDMDLLASINGGSGSETKANYIELIMTGDQAGTGTVLVTGAASGGPEEAIASLAITVGTVVETSPREWVDTMVLTNLHLSRCSVNVADSGNSRIAKFGFDAIGYRFLRFYPTLTTITNLKIYGRHF